MSYRHEHSFKRSLLDIFLFPYAIFKVHIRLMFYQSFKIRISSNLKSLVKPVMVNSTSLLMGLVLSIF